MTGLMSDFYLDLEPVPRAHNLSVYRDMPEFVSLVTADGLLIKLKKLYAYFSNFMRVLFYLKYRPLVVHGMHCTCVL